MGLVAVNDDILIDLGFGVLDPFGCKVSFAEAMPTGDFDMHERRGSYVRSNKGG